MAGRNQHHIPQSVLRGFARDPNEDPKRVWHYLRGAPVVHKATSEVAAQRDFYSKPDGSGTTLDDVITSYENGQFTALLHRLRNLDPGTAVAHADATEYLGHLIPRGDHIRRVFGEAMGLILSETKSFASDPQRLAIHLGLDDLEPGGVALNEIQRLLNDPRIAPFLAMIEYPKSLLERLGFALMREFAAPLLTKTAGEMSDQFAAMSIDVKGRVRQAHTDALTRVGTGHRMPKLEGMAFAIEASKAELVLPDCVAVGLNEVAEAFPFGMIKREEVVLMVAPLSPHRMLVGRALPDAEVPGDDQLARKLASCSHMFFVAATDNFRDLQTMLGEVTQAEVSRIIGGVFDRDERFLEGGDAIPPQDGTFNLITPSGFSDAEIAELGAFIADVAGDVHASLPLHCLEGVTISENGDLDASGLYLVDPGAVEGTLQDGKLRLRGFLPRALGETLVREGTEEDFLLSLYLLTSALTRVGAASRLDGLSAKYFRDAGLDWHPALHQRGVVLALPVYIALVALRATGEDERLFKLLDQAAVNALIEADARMETAKAAFLSDSNADRFGYAAGDCVLMVTSASAAIAGRGNGELTHFPDFAQEIEKRGLTAWLNRFERDLDKFWSEPRAVADPRSWGIHSERLMLHWGIVSWPGEGGTFTIGLPPMELMRPIQQALMVAADRLGRSSAQKG